MLISGSLSDDVAAASCVIRPLRNLVTSDNQNVVLEALADVEARAAPILTRPTASPSCGYYFTSAVQGLRARHVLAEIALSAARGGVDGDIVRLTKHLHADPPIAHVLVEAYVGAFLFGAWSTIETLVFATNAIGVALDPTGFDSLETTTSLRRVAPSRVTKEHAAAYQRWLPRFTAAFASRLQLVNDLREHHNASKHRHATFGGGRMAMGAALATGINRARAVGDEQSAVNLLERGFRNSGVLEVRVLKEPHIARAERSGHALPPGVTIPTGAILGEPTVPLEPIVDGWREALAAMLGALRDDLA